MPATGSRFLSMARIAPRRCRFSPGCYAVRSEGHSGSVNVDADLLQGFYLNEILIEPLTGRVTVRSDARHLPPKAMEVLVCLAQAPGELVTRETLIREVWGPGHGSDEALSHAISEIRHALDDQLREPRPIRQ